MLRPRNVPRLTAHFETLTCSKNRSMACHKTQRRSLASRSQSENPTYFRIIYGRMATPWGGLTTTARLPLCLFANSGLPAGDGATPSKAEAPKISPMGESPPVRVRPSGERHEVPAHDHAEAYLDVYVAGSSIAAECKRPRFRPVTGKTGQLAGCRINTSERTYIETMWNGFVRSFAGYL
jgi:hypothetical protein